MIEAINTFTGQKSRYGDFFREWKVKTDCSKEVTLEWCFANLMKREKVLPERQEWLQKQKKPDGSIDLSVYFRGYYTIKPTSDGFQFTICEPYAD